ncbi:OLC1v1033845C1 [Oldenlandia corymbosa var. corymbosa]|uniref:OLC1v1033845C1 n=1 Tax=Oldenlandia corymbosa var. corymbosa TaxID=529605 RepID=A0AAV1CRT4_OLDCO|nr:OLC1v1033845C1 [Oldenlandia corymbosa var. corymbosa]
MAPIRTTVETSDGAILDARLYMPRETPPSAADNILVVVLVHPYTILGGRQGRMKGIALELAQRGFTAVTFNMRGAGKSTGCPSLCGSSEIEDVIAVCHWASETLATHRILLVGSSAGAAIAGSAVDKIEEVVGYVSLGYPFGLAASILFGRHHRAILESTKPKLFVMGTKDCCATVKQLENKLETAAGRNETFLIEGATHYQLEGTPEYDSRSVDLIVQFIQSLQGEQEPG